MKIELCTSSIEDIIIANKYNFERIEINSALSCGGLTPSYFFVKKAIELSNKKIIAMIRLREGSFNYNENEIDIMYNDAISFLKLGVKGIVFGFLNSDNSLDIKNTEKFIKLAKKYDADAVFNRAIDVSDKYIENIEKLKELGITRVLTSGYKKDVIEGKDNLLLALKKNLPIIIGSGITEENISKFLKLGFNEIHGSFSELEIINYKIDFGKSKKLSIEKINKIF